MLAERQFRMEGDDPGPAAEPQVDWTKARCRDGAGTMTALFFSEEIGDILRAKAICNLCGIREACLEAALERREPWGVWGGELFLNGKVLAQKRKRGRPPKHPRPEPVIEAWPA